MNIPSQDRQTNQTLLEENSIFSENTEGISYGLETTNNTSNEQQLGTISNDNLLDETVDASQVDGGDIAVQSYVRTYQLLVRK